MLTLDQLEARVSQILNNFFNFNKSSDIKSLYEEVKKQVPSFPQMSDKEWKNTQQAANNLLSNYAIHLYQERLKKEGVDSEAEKKKLSAYLYDKNWDEFFQMVQLEHTEQAAENRPKMTSPEKIVYNLKGYDEGIDISPPSNSEQGADLQLNPGAPIGYVINLPPGEIKGVQVSAYGGFNKQDRKNRLNTPGALDSEDRALLANGIAVVELNLIDLLKLEHYQNLMPSNLHAELHASINQFWETLHKTPESLSPALANLKEKPIFLRGASWGGRTAIRHAELYPNTFSGYISFDGGVSSEMDSKSDRTLVGSRAGALEYLDPASHINDLQDPILLIHNANDNNVNLKVSLDFYDKAKNQGKEDLLSVHINHKGNVYEKREGVWNTGHFTPDSGSIEFENQVNAVSNFIIHGTDKLPELTTWRTIKYNSISDRNYNLATASDLFVEYVNRTYKDKLPAHTELSEIFSVFELIEKYPAGTIRTAFDTPIPDAELKSGLKKELTRVNSYFKEKYHLEFDSEITPEMLAVYQQSILKADTKLHRELILTFILANPKYIEKIHNWIASKPGYDASKRDALLKLIKQRSTFHTASKTALRSMLQRGLEYEKQLETQIRNGDVKALRSLIATYNSSGNARTLTERLERIFIQMTEDAKLNMIRQVANEIITDCGIRNEIFEAIRNMMTVSEYENLISSSVPSINKMMSGWINKSQLDRLTNILQDVNPKLKKVLLNVNALRELNSLQLEKLSHDLSDDEVYELFTRVEDKETALTSNHNLSYLKYVKSRVGAERFKKLLEFDLGEGIKGTVLESYIQHDDIESFEFLISHLSSEELILHIQNNKNMSSNSRNLISSTFLNGNAEHFDVLISKLQSDQQIDKLRSFILDQDVYGASGFKYALESVAYDVNKFNGYLQKIMQYCTPDDLAVELKSHGWIFVEILRYVDHSPERRSIADQVKSKLGYELFADVLGETAEQIVLQMIKAGEEAFEHEVIKLLGVDRIRECVDRILEEMFSSRSISKASFDLIRHYSNRADLDAKIAKYCAESLKDRMNSRWYSAGSISKIISCLVPKEYGEFQRQLLLEPNSLVSYFRPEQVKSNDNFAEIIKELLSAPDEMLPYIFPLEILKLALGSNDAWFQTALNDIKPKGPNLSMIEKILTKQDDELVHFISSPSSSLLASVLFLRNEADQNYLINLISGLPKDAKKELISVGVLKNIKQGSALSRLLNEFSDDEIYSLFSRVENKWTALTSDHDLFYLKYVKRRVGAKRFKKLLEFDVGEGLKGTVLKSYIQHDDIESFKFLINQLSLDELIGHIQNNKNVSSYADNLIVDQLGFGKSEHFEALVSRFKSDGKAESLRTFVLDKDNSGRSGLGFVFDLIISNPERYYELLKQTLEICTPEDLEAELESDTSRLPEILRYAHDSKVKTLELLKTKLGDRLFEAVVKEKAKEIVAQMVLDGSKTFENEVINLLGKDRIKDCVEDNLDGILSSYSVSKTSFDLIRHYSNRADLDGKIAKYCAESLKDRMNSRWYSSGSISEMLNCLEPSDFDEFRRQLLLEPNSLPSYFKPEKLQSTEKFSEKIKELLSAPDEMLPYIFPLEILKLALSSNDAWFNTALNDIKPKGPNLSMIEKILTKQDNKLVQFISSPSSSSLSSALLWRNEADQNYLINLISGLPKDAKKELISVEVLKNIKQGSALSKLLNEFSDDEIYALFSRVVDKETALASTHDVSYLSYLKERSGEERFKNLIEIDLGNGIKGSVLIRYVTQDNVESFKFLINQLSLEELIEHIQNNKNVSQYKDNLIVYLLAGDHLEHFETLVSRFKSDGKENLLRTLVLDKDNSGKSGLGHVIDLSSRDPRYYDLLKQTLEICTPEDLAAELKSDDSVLPDILRYGSQLDQMKATLELIKYELGQDLFEEVVKSNTKKVVATMIQDGREALQNEVIRILGDDRIKECVDDKLDELLSSDSLSKPSVDLIRRYSSRADLGEKIAKCCAESLKEKMNSRWYSAGSISEILNCLEPVEYDDFKRYLLLEPNSFASYFKPEQLKSNDNFAEKIKELLSAPDEMIPVIFNESVIKSILAIGLQDFVLSSYNTSLAVDKNLGRLLDTMYLTKMNPHFANVILDPASDSLLYLMSEGIEPRDEGAFQFCWKTIFTFLDNQQIKTILRSEVLSRIQDPILLSDALEKLTGHEVFELFSQPESKELLKSYPESLLKVVGDRVGSDAYIVLKRDSAGDKVQIKNSTTQIFDSSKDIKSKPSAPQDQGLVDKSESKMKTRK